MRFRWNFFLLWSNKNPRNIDYVSGGSSSGSAASVAADFADLSIGSDTGGSIRCPLAFVVCMDSNRAMD